MNLAKSDFREDINGLRAIAVLSVVIFHFSPAHIKGGFVGVDIFFVISGYLMTSIIFRGFERNDFSIFLFLKNRAKRILPTLLVVTFLLLIFGYATLGAGAYKILSAHIIDSLLFFSNVTYANESGYFDDASNTKFLLHTWSLSVEWQFYLIYPIVLICLRRFFTVSALKIIIVLILFLSLIASVYFTKVQPEKSYFMLYTRAWEMLFGGLAYLYPLKASVGKRTRFLLEFFGLLLIAISIFKIDGKTPWPGYIALIPIVGTYFVIFANNQKTIFSWVVFKKIGLWSYSIYLVHWPIVVFNELLGWGISFAKYIAIVFAISFIVFHLVEKRREYNHWLVISFFGVLLMAMLVKQTNGLESRFNVPDESKQSLVQGGSNINPMYWKEHNSKETNDFVFYGDSFNAHYDYYAESSGKAMAMLFSPQCLSTQNFYSYGEKCKGLYSIFKEEMNKKPANVLVISQAWSWALKELKNKNNEKPVNFSIDEFLIKYLDELRIIKKETGVNKIVLIGVNNHFIGKLPKECISSMFENTIYQYYFGKSTCENVVPLMKTNYVEGFNEKLKEFSKIEDWLHFINPNDAVCKDDKCIQIENGLSLYADRSHFSTYGSKKVGKFIFDELNRIAN